MQKLHLDDDTYESLMRTFQKIDRTNRKQLSFHEFLDFYGMEETYFSRLIFSRMDYGHQGSLTFEEYVSFIIAFVIVIYIVILLMLLVMFCE